MHHSASGVFPIRLTRRALIVTRTAANAEALAEMLRFFGFEPGVASNTAAAVRLAAQLEPVIGIIDVTSAMPLAIDPVRELRASASRRCKFVALTPGFGRGPSPCALRGFDAVLTLPVSLETLLATLVASGSAILA